MGYQRCLCQLARSGRFFPLVHHEVVADNAVVYSGYSDRRAWQAFIIAGKHGAKRVIRFINGVGVTFSKAVP